MRRRELVTGAAALAAYAQLPKSAEAAFGLGSLGAGFGQPIVGGSSVVQVPVWANVQTKKDITQNTSPFSVSFTSPVTSGNIVVGSFLCSINSFVQSITDDKGNSYQIVGQDGSAEGNNNIVGFRSQGALTNGPQTITVTLSAAPALVWFIIDEFTAGFPLGSDLALDGAQLAVNQTGGVMQPLTTAFANDLLYCGVFSSSTSTPGSGWTATSGSGSQQMAMWKQGAAAGNVTPLFSTAGTVWNAALAVRAVARNNWQLRQNANRFAVTVGAGGTATPAYNAPLASGSIGLGVLALGTVAAGDNNIANLTSIVDDKGHTWSIVRSAFIGRTFFWSGGPVNWAPQTLTITVNHTEAVINTLLTEFIPPPGTTTFAVESLTGDGVVTTSGSVPFTVGPITPPQNGDLIYAMIDNGSNGSRVTTGFAMVNGQNMALCDSYLHQYAAAAVSVQYTGSGSTGGDQGIIALKAS